MLHIDVKPHYAPQGASYLLSFSASSYAWFGRHRCALPLQALLRSLGAEADALQKIHIRIQRQLQNLEVGSCCVQCCHEKTDAAKRGPSVYASSWSTHGNMRFRTMLLCSPCLAFASCGAVYLHISSSRHSNPLARCSCAVVLQPLISLPACRACVLLLMLLQVEEKLILQMTQRERSHISAEELQGFDMQQQQQQQPGQPQQHSATPHTAGGEQQQQQQQAGPEPEQQQAQKSQQGEPDVVTYSMAAHMQDESMDEVPVEEF